MRRLNGSKNRWMPGSTSEAISEETKISIASAPILASNVSWILPTSTSKKRGPTNRVRRQNEQANYAISFARCLLWIESAARQLRLERRSGHRFSSGDRREQRDIQRRQRGAPASVALSRRGPHCSHSGDQQR